MDMQRLVRILMTALFVLAAVLALPGGMGSAPGTGEAHAASPAHGHQHGDAGHGHQLPDDPAGSCAMTMGHCITGIRDVAPVSIGRSGPRILVLRPGGSVAASGLPHETDTPPPRT